MSFRRAITTMGASAPKAHEVYEQAHEVVIRVAPVYVSKIDCCYYRIILHQDVISAEIVVLAPIEKASVSVTIMVKPGLFRSIRRL